MKKYTIIALTLALCGSIFAGCGCMNQGPEPTVTVAPSEEVTVPSRATTAPTEAMTTETTMDTRPTGETGMTGDGNAAVTEDSGNIMDNATNETGSDGANGADMERNRSRRIPPMG